MLELVNVTTLWAVIGVCLLVLELFSMTFVFLFFGISALFVALATVLGLDHRPLEIVLFSVLSVLSIFLFRQKIRNSFKRTPQYALEETLVLKVNIAADGGTAEIHHQGAIFTAVNVSHVPLVPGDRARIVGALS